MKIDKYNRGKLSWKNLPKRVQDQIQRNPGGMQERGISARCTIKWYASSPGRTRFPSDTAGERVFRATPPKKVFIHVRGGVAYCDRVPKGVEVKIIDHDNEGHQ
jgi:hypothetical protein